MLLRRFSRGIGRSVAAPLGGAAWESRRMEVDPTGPGPGRPSGSGSGLGSRLEHLPYLDRYAYAWMWQRGGWDIVGGPLCIPPDGQHAMAPRHPKPSAPAIGQNDAPPARIGDHAG